MRQWIRVFGMEPGKPATTVAVVGICDLSRRACSYGVAKEEQDEAVQHLEKQPALPLIKESPKVRVRVADVPVAEMLLERCQDSFPARAAFNRVACPMGRMICDLDVA
jgi:hypothetical protein